MPISVVIRDSLARLLARSVNLSGSAFDNGETDAPFPWQRQLNDASAALSRERLRVNTLVRGRRRSARYNKFRVEDSR